GTTNEYLFIRNYEIESGRGFIPEDIKNSTKVAIIGQTVATELFGDVDPINKTIRIGNIPFKIIGLLKSKGSNGMGQDQDDLVFIPITTAQRKVFGTSFPGTVSMITVKAQNDEVLSIAQEDITEILKKRHRIGVKQDNDFEINNFDEIMETIKSTSRTMSLFLLIIAGVSLLVGGIGIMNIMLVSVTERTKEIGIRMSIGAKSSDIRFQFLLESFILSMSGGGVGVITGIVGTYILHALMGMNVAITISSIILSLGFSAAIGIGFGYYPAYKASLLNPIDALRYE
ncbi:ABC transporter permease, partial [bacterium]|nr:ABC transporter permease [bacterium]